MKSFNLIHAFLFNPRDSKKNNFYFYLRKQSQTMTYYSPMTYYFYLPILI